MFSSTLHRFRKMVALYVLTNAGAALASTVVVYLFQKLVDQLTIGASLKALLPLVAGYGVLSLLEYLLNYAEEYPQNKLTNGIYHHLKSEALAKVSRVDYTAYQDIGTGQLVQLIENGAAAGRDILCEFYLRIAAQLLPGMLFSILVMGLYSPAIMAGALSGYLLVFLVTKLLLKKLYAIKEETLVTEEALSKAYVRAFMEMVVFRINRRFGHELRRTGAMAEKITGAKTHIRMVHEFFFTAFAILVLLIKVLLILLGVGMIAGGSLSVGILLALLSLIDRVYQPIAIFNVLYVDFKLNHVTWKRFEAFLDTPDDPNMVKGESLEHTNGEITLQSLSFGYGGLPLLKDVSLAIPAGKTTAFVGASGAGKSTLVKLMLGLLKPTAGAILIDDHDLSDMELTGYYRHVAYMSQDAPVFDGTLRENLCFDETTDDAPLWEALTLAQLDGMVRALPAGLDTPVGEHGVKLSGGERQRLAFARVFYQQPAIILLDEPTSALDHPTEQRVMQALRRRLADKTIISIAHRLSTIEDADQIAVLHRGRIVELGTHAELMARKGHYAGMVWSDSEAE